MTTNTTTEKLPVREIRTRDLQVGDTIQEGNQIVGFSYWTVTDIKVEQSFSGAKKWRVFSEHNPVAGQMFGATNRIFVVIK